MRFSAALAVFAVVLAAFLVGCGGKVDLDNSLLKAVETGNLSEATTLLKRGADVDATDDFGRTPLMMASLGGHTQITKLLMEAGADVHATAKYGQTALQFAVEGGKTDIASILQAGGAGGQGSSEAPEGK